MSYASKYGRRPPEYASKASHQEIIKDKAVQAFLAQCKLPSAAEDVKTDDCEAVLVEDGVPAGIRHIVAIDGGYGHTTNAQCKRVSEEPRKLLRARAGTTMTSISEPMVIEAEGL